MRAARRRHRAIPRHLATDADYGWRVGAFVRAFWPILAIVVSLAALAVSRTAFIVVVAVWVLVTLVFLIRGWTTGLSFLVRTRKRYCPRCGQRVQMGEPACPRCDFRFRTSGVPPES